MGLIRDSMYGIPVVQSFHLLGLTLLLGMVVFLNLRLVGLSFRQLPLPLAAQQVLFWLLCGLCLTVATGIIIFLTDPVRYAASDPFRIKMILLCLAVIYHFTVFRRLVKAEPRSDSGKRLAAIVSLTLWFGIGWAGRAIAFFR